jgi:hypothetical protein
MVEPRCYTRRGGPAGSPAPLTARSPYPDRQLGQDVPIWPGHPARSIVRSVTRLAVVAFCVVLVAVAVNYVMPTLSAAELLAPAPLPSPAPTLPFTDVNPYGANFLLEWEPEEWKVEKTFEMAKAAGVHWVKQDFPWDSLQLAPGPNGYWDERLNKSTWDKYDQIVQLAHKYNLEVIARLDRPPSWTRADNQHPERPPDNFDRYGDFVSDVVTHFKGQIHYYQIWNEPNIYPEWGEQAPDAAGYVHLLQIAHDRAKQVDPNVVILSAPLAQTLEVSTHNEADLRYLKDMYAAGAKGYFDILFANAYGFAFPPDDPVSPDRLNFRRVELLRQIMVQNGDGGKPVWFNEFGWDAAPDSFPNDVQSLPWGRVTEQQQAQYTVEAIQYARAHWPWAGVFNVWYFRQTGDIIPANRADYYFRMVDPGFTPRPLYNAIKDLATSLPSVGSGTFAVTDPSASFDGSWQPILAPNAVGGVIQSSAKQGDSLTITFRGGGLNLFLQRGPDAGQIYLTVDGREANKVPDHVQGRSVLNLNGSDREAPVEVPISDDLGPGQHTLRLVIGPSGGSDHGRVNVAGFAVRAVDRFAALLRAGAIVGAALLGAIVILLSLRAWSNRRT